MAFLTSSSSRRQSIYISRDYSTHWPNQRPCYQQDTEPSFCAARQSPSPVPRLRPTLRLLPRPTHRKSAPVQIWCGLQRSQASDLGNEVGDSRQEEGRAAGDKHILFCRTLVVLFFNLTSTTIRCLVDAAFLLTSSPSSLSKSTHSPPTGLSRTRHTHPRLSHTHSVCLVATAVV